MENDKPKFKLFTSKFCPNVKPEHGHLPSFLLCIDDKNTSSFKKHPEKNKLYTVKAYNYCDIRQETVVELIGDEIDVRQESEGLMVGFNLNKFVPFSFSPN